MSPSTLDEKQGARRSRRPSWRRRDGAALPRVARAVALL